MMNWLKRFGWQQWLVLIALLGVVGFTGLQTLRTVNHISHAQYQKDEKIHGWMTLGYLGHSYHVPPQVLQAALALPDSPPDTRPLVAIAKAQGRSVEELIVSLQAAIRQARALSKDSPPLEQRDKP